VNVPGIDAILVGPYDLSASLGKPGQVSDPEVQQAIATIRESCLKAGVRLGAFAADARAARAFVEQGFTLIAVGIDSLFLMSAAGDTLASTRGTPPA
jgi:2-dehydro-3-deoxyglucarate aldolase/4-hydroxy-2-oxoheptanedioate aldolase